MRACARLLLVAALCVACSDPTGAENAGNTAATGDAVAGDSAVADATGTDAEPTDAAVDAAEPTDVAVGDAEPTDAAVDDLPPTDAQPDDLTPLDSDGGGDQNGEDAPGDVADQDISPADQADAASPIDCGPSCDDADPCTADSCDTTTGICTHTPQPGAPCDDAEDCTVGDACEGGKCAPGKLSAACQCLSDADCLSLDDGKLCNGTLMCKKTEGGAQCVTNSGTVYKCEAPTAPCQTAACVEPVAGSKPSCVQGPAKDGTACEDGLTWTIGDWCQAGACQAGTDTAPCLQDADCAKMEDQDLCNGTMFCNKATASCQVNPKTVVVCPTVDDTPCAKSICQPKTGVCALLALSDGKACDDGNSCTSGEACDKGLCTASAGSNICVCTQDADCDKLEDGDFCNGTMYCDKAAATCKLNPATVVSCPSAQDTACTKNLCNKGNGQCQPTWMPNGTLCDADGSACTPIDVCDKGVCKADTPICECQVDSDCEGKEDGDLCNGTLYCNKATKACEVNPATVIKCQTALDTDCLKSACQPATGKCQPVPLPLGGTCTDANACTQGDGCDGKGVCVPGTPFCDCLGDADCPDLDKEPCNGVRYCDKLNVPYKCKDKPGSPMLENQACDDATVCTVGDVCKGGVCTGTGIGCDDSNPCTDDQCDAKGGCLNLPSEVTCTDNNPCTVGELCGGGKCLAGKPINCDDASPCTVDACEASVGCMHADSDQPCTDGNACTVGDACKVGKCVAGIAASCEDATVCTTDSCNTQTGCEHLLNQGACSDGNPCTAGDKCNGTACVSGTLLNCDDGEQCTTDACDDAKGACAHTNVQGPCTDGNACTTGDACASSGGKWTCVAPGKPNCDDGNPCTNDSCDTIKGCVHANNSFSQSCYTGPGGTDKYAPCKAGLKYCSNGSFGACQGEVKPGGEVCNGIDDNCDGAIDNGVNCDDGNACSDDSCAGVAGCKHPNTANNSKWCGTWNLCTNGSCLAVEGNKWVNIAAGTYTIGCVSGDTLCLADEKPQHTVKMHAYAMLETEVTVAQYLKCVQKGACPAPATNKQYGCDGTAPFTDAMNWTAASGARTDRYDHPVTCVSWIMAISYCSWLIDPFTTDLPTEAQWEVAARAGFLYKYVWSNNFPPTGKVGNLGDVTGKATYPTMPTTVSSTFTDGYAATSPVKAFAANGFGLYGMAGNVQEWTLDGYNATFYSTSAASGWDPVFPGPGGNHVQKGGSWWSGPAGSALLYRVSYRGANSPEQTFGTANGFRCVKTL